ncbi:hypothetical protein VTN02DRAFT_1205 [Thermoascus thermophilus]
MRFSVAAIGALAAGAVAQSFTTDVIYETETYCPESATAAPVQSSTPIYSPEPTTTEVVYDTETYCPEESATATPVTPSVIPVSVAVTPTPVYSSTPVYSPKPFTQVVSSFETYVSEATSFVYGSQTYSVTKPTTVTMTNGQYTISRPLLTSTVTICNSCTGATAAPVSYSASSYIPSVSRVYSSSKVVVATSVATQNPSTAVSTSVPVFTGAASRAAAGAGAGLAGVFALAAYLL